MNATAAMMKDGTALEGSIDAVDTGSLQYEMVSKLAAKMNISLEEARAALGSAGWNELTATYLLEKEAFRRKLELEEAIADAERTVSAERNAYAMQTVPRDRDGHTDRGGKETVNEHTAEGGKETVRKLGRMAMDLIARGNRSRFVIHRGGRQLMDLPVTILVLLFLCSFGTSAFLLAAGLFAGCRYSFSDPAQA